MNDPAIDVAWSGPSQCEHCGIRHLVLFSALEREEFALIHEPIDEMELGKGRRLYHEGDVPDYVYTVRQGAIKLERALPDGSDRIVRILTRGDVAGLEALLGQPYRHDAVVIDPVMVCRIPVRTINHLNRELPHFHRQLMGRWQEAVTAADAWLTELATGTARARVARLLLRFSEGHTGGSAFFVPKREDMAAMIGVSTETVSRVTAEFARLGYLVNASSNHVQIDAGALGEVASEA